MRLDLERINQKNYLLKRKMKQSMETLTNLEVRYELMNSKHDKRLINDAAAKSALDDAAEDVAPSEPNGEIVIANRRQSATLGGRKEEIHL